MYIEGRLSMNSKSNNKNLLFLLLGLMLLLLNSILELGVIPYLKEIALDNEGYNVLKWISVIVSNVCLALGLSLIISVITKWVEKSQIDYRNLSIQEATNIIGDIVSNTDDSNLNAYKKERALKIYNINYNIRTRTAYNVEVYIENNRVCAKTNQIFLEHKTSGNFSKIANYSNSESMIIESIKISDPSDTNNSKIFKNNDVKIRNITAFSEELRFERFVEIPEEFKDKDLLLIEKEFVLIGEDHWLNYALMFMRPSLGVNFNLVTRDNLIIKEVTVFGDDNIYSKDQKDNRLVLNSTNWIANNNGFSVIIARKDE